MKIIPAFVRRRIAHRPNLVKIVDNIGWLFFDKVLRMGVVLFLGTWVARYLGPEQFGILNFALAFTALFGALAALGMQEIVVRDIAREPDCAGLTLGTAAVLQLFGGLVTFLLILFAIGQLRPDDPLARTIVAILGSMMLLKVSAIAVYWFESQVQSKYTVWVQSSVFILFAAFNVLLILNHAPLVAFVWAMLAEAAVVAIVLLIIFCVRGPALNRLRVSGSRAMVLLRDSWPLILSSIAITVYMKIDQIMLSQMIGDEAVGIYSAAVRISEAWYFIPVVVVASVFPAILEAKRRSETLYYNRLQNLYDFMVLLSVSVALPMTFIATPLVILLFGVAYAESGVILAIHIWGAVFVFLGVASGKWFLAENRQILSLKRALIGAAVNVALNFWWIPLYGPAGAASATVISYAIADFFSDLAQKETRKMFIMKLSAMNPLGVYRRFS